MATTKISSITVDGVDLFYRSAGSPSSPVILLLHGFPSSSHQYRNLIPLLASNYHVIAPDLPGFGFTVVPENRQYKYTFASLAITVGAFVDALKISKFAIYIFDYGAPTGLRLALERPEAITAIISQNGNAYVEGLGAFWNPIKAYWASGSISDREVLRNTILTFEATKWQYENGAPSPGSVSPETYYLDYTLMERPGNKDIQLDLFRDYGTNLPLYPKFQEYFRNSNVPVLAVWGKNDEIFIPPGAEAFKKDVKRLEVHLLDAPHFAIETNERAFAGLILDFLQKHGI
ncbi:alpha/beta-hydrolase [Stipitochalara longipes BDJ]|nr:alpha/beta-hydrolase [Stipitochalara longipes BDJ]